MNDSVRSCFAPSMYFMGCQKGNSQLESMIEQLMSECRKGHITGEKHFVENKDHMLKRLVDEKKINLVDGAIVGIKTYKGRAILLDDLMEDKFLDISSDCCGIYIPKDELLVRTKYQWFAYLSKREIMDANVAIVKYLKGSIVDINTLLRNDFKAVTSL